MSEDLKIGDRVNYRQSLDTNYEPGTLLGFVMDAGERMAVVKWPLSAPERHTVHLAVTLNRCDNFIEPGDLVREVYSSKAALDGEILRVIGQYRDWFWLVPVNGSKSPYTRHRDDTRLYRKGG